MLCPTHNGQRFGFGFRRCEACPKSTPNSKFRLCITCSNTLNECQVCRTKVNGSQTHSHNQPGPSGNGSTGSPAPQPKDGN